MWIVDGKQVSIEGMREGLKEGEGNADGCHSWFCFDSSLREGRSCDTQVCQSCCDVYCLLLTGYLDTATMSELYDDR
jgi:hypothetical protein